MAHKKVIALQSISGGYFDVNTTEKRSHANILQDTGLQLISNALPHENDTAHVYFTKEFTLCKTKHVFFFSIQSLNRSLPRTDQMFCHYGWIKFTTIFYSFAVMWQIWSQVLTAQNATSWMVAISETYNSCSFIRLTKGVNGRPYPVACTW